MSGVEGEDFSDEACVGCKTGLEEVGVDKLGLQEGRRRVKVKEVEGMPRHAMAGILSGKKLKMERDHGLS